MDEKNAAEFERFLLSSGTNVELLSPETRELLHVRTPLEDVVRAAIAANASVIITGSAGSGKTHLIESADIPPQYKVVRDLSATDPADWSALLTKQPFLVAGNEGAFIQGDLNGVAGFKSVVQTLHRIQRGEFVNAGEFVLVDAAAFDPAASRVIERILENQFLADLVSMQGDNRRTLAWCMLASPKVRRKVADLVALGSSQAGGDGITFRQLWQFVADLALGGTGENGLWLNRIFSGASLVSRCIIEAYHPSNAALPHVGARLYYGDYLAIKEKLVPESKPLGEAIIQPAKVLGGGADRVGYETLRNFAIFALEADAVPIVSGSSDDAWSKVVSDDDHRRLLKLINRYLGYGVLKGSDNLQLWITTETERRELKPDVQISLGRVDADKFEILRNYVIANPPAGTPPQSGGRVMLALKGSNIRLRVSKSFVSGISETRSPKSADRMHVEYDWLLLNFLAQVATTESRLDSFEVSQFEFASRTGVSVAWDISDGGIRMQ